MPTRDGQEHAHRHDSTTEVEEAVDAPASATTVDKEALDADVDAILDEIDEVLEVNAEEFVRQFVQKGGQ
jgi:ubiquitin-like protein Pup